MEKPRDAQELLRTMRMDEQTRMRYAAEIRPERLRQGRTQGEVAQLAGVSRNTVLAMESGNAVPQAEKLLKVMLVLGIAPEAEEPEWLQEWWRVISPLARRLPESRRGEVFGDIVVRLYQGITDSKAPIRPLRTENRDVRAGDDIHDQHVIAAMEDYPGENMRAEMEEYYRERP